MDFQQNLLQLCCDIFIYIMVPNAFLWLEMSEGILLAFGGTLQGTAHQWSLFVIELLNNRL